MSGPDLDARCTCDHQRRDHPAGKGCGMCACRAFSDVPNLVRFLDGHATIPSEEAVASVALRSFLETLGRMAADEAVGITNAQGDLIREAALAPEDYHGRKLRAVLVLYTGKRVTSTQLQRIFR